MRVLKYGVVGSAIGGTAVSLHGNDYNINSIGIVRLMRAGIAGESLKLVNTKKRL